ncbi:MAG: hypothetical protein ED556_00120 [Winogradskyella sp.]|uniref:hypothetical protein n=1 Tax=Winogradskyella sp. TaxID=1883156 RepID=UPI000F41D1D8|nr:hypothetical protein [Winogradskyella sp.]RNC87633.1 MAG: hypothetical protein ED556_00120 [Winogradskyella sp.]
MVIISKYIVPKGYFGLTVFPFIFLNRKELRQNQVLLNHEKIHLRQQLELLVIPFYVVYFFEFIFRFIKLRNWQAAYRAISFEREAYENDSDLKFLKKRPFWNFIHYF